MKQQLVQVGLSERTFPWQTHRQLWLEDCTQYSCQAVFLVQGVIVVLLSQVVGSSFAFLLYPMSKRCLVPLFFLLTLWAPLLFSISLSRRFYNCTAARSGVFSQFATPSLLCSCGCSIRSFSLQSLFCFRSFLKPEQGIRWSIPHSLYCAYPLSSLPHFPPVLYYHILFVVSRTMSKQK